MPARAAAPAATRWRARLRRPRAALGRRELDDDARLRRRGLAHHPPAERPGDVEAVRPAVQGGVLGRGGEDSAPVRRRTGAAARGPVLARRSRAASSCRGSPGSSLGVVLQRGEAGARLARRQQRPPDEVMHARGDARNRRGALGQLEGFVGLDRQQIKARARQRRIGRGRAAAKDVVEDRRGGLGRARPVEPGGERQGPAGETAAASLERGIGGQRHRLVDEIVDLLVDGGAPFGRHQRRPLGDRPLEMRDVAFSSRTCPSVLSFFTPTR